MSAQFQKYNSKSDPQMVEDIIVTCTFFFVPIFILIGSYLFILSNKWLNFSLYILYKL